MPVRPPPRLSHLASPRLRAGLLALGLALGIVLSASLPGGALAQPVPPAEPAEATASDGKASSKLRAEAREVLLLSRDLIGSAYDEIKRVTKLTDDQLYGAGVGALGGLLVGDVIGAHGLLSLTLIGAGAYFGQVIATPQEPTGGR